MKQGKSLIAALVWASFLLPAFAQTDDSDAALRAELQQLQQAVTASKQAEASGKVSPQAAANAQTSSATSAQQTQTQTAQPQTAQPVTPAPDESLQRQAFLGMKARVLPLSPRQVETLHHVFNETQRAAAIFPGVLPRPTSSSLLVNLAPGATPPVVRLSAGYVTSLVFLDSTGQPWPIQAYDLGDPRAFNIQWNKKSNTLLVQAIAQYKSGNLAVVLKGKSTPVMVTLIPGQRAVDYRVDLRVPGLGPNAAPVTSGLPNAENPQLVAVLDGVPPQGGQALIVEGGDAQAWLAGGKIFLRTRLTVLSPGYLSSIESSDGTHAYVMQQTPVILASDHGKSIELSIKGLQ